MINIEVFHEQIKRLEVVFNWSLPQGADTAWFQELKDQQLSDTDFKGGVTACIMHCKRFPSLAELIDYAEKKRRARMLDEHYKKKSIPVEDAFNIPTNVPLGKECIAMWRKLYDDQITIKEYVAWMRTKGWNRGASIVKKNRIKTLQKKIEISNIPAYDMDFYERRVAKDVDKAQKELAELTAE